MCPNHCSFVYAMFFSPPVSVVAPYHTWSPSFDITQAHLQTLWCLSEHAVTTQVLSPASVSGEAAAGNICKATGLDTQGKLTGHTGQLYLKVFKYNQDILYISLNYFWFHSLPILAIFLRFFKGTCLTRVSLQFKWYYNLNISRLICVYLVCVKWWSSQHVKWPIQTVSPPRLVFFWSALVQVCVFLLFCQRNLLIKNADSSLSLFSLMPQKTCGSM